MVKDKHIISELNGFFHKNDCNKAINSIMTTIRHLNLRSSCIGIEKRHNCSPARRTCSIVSWSSTTLIGANLSIWLVFAC